MNISILVSTYGKSNPKLQYLKGSTDDKIDFVIIHQKPDMISGNQLSKIYGSNYYTSNTIGLSKSRNLAISKANSDICLIADDDASFVEELHSIVLNAFRENPKADIITFKICVPGRGYYKNYSTKKFWYKRKNIFKVSSIEIAFKSNSIKKCNLKFDEEFGLGSKYPLGEEAIFLNDALINGLKVLYLPIGIVYHPIESTGKKYTIEKLRARGAQIARIFGFGFILIDFLFFLKILRSSKYKGPLTVFKQIYMGSIKYMLKKIINFID